MDLSVSDQLIEFAALIGISDLLYHEIYSMNFKWQTAHLIKQSHRMQVD